MDRGSTLFLRVVIFVIAAVMLGLCLIAVPIGITSDETGDYRPILAGLYIPAVPFFFALYQALKLLKLIDKDRAFSKGSVMTLMNIKYCAIAISAIFAAGMPYVFYVADKDDAPGVVAVGLVIIFASMVIATFAAVLQKLVQHAVDIKSEHDLTV